MDLDQPILEKIAAFLDYESRIQFNRCLKPWNRVTIRYSLQRRKGHDLYVQMNICKHLMDKLEATDHHDPRIRARRKSRIFFDVLYAFVRGGRCYPLLQNHGLRQVMRGKMLEILDRNSTLIAVASTYYKRKLKRLARLLLAELEEYPETIEYITVRTITQGSD